MRERSEQFLKQNGSLTYYWMFLRSNRLDQLTRQVAQIIGMLKTTGTN